MNKDLSVSVLMDFYAALLTEKQRMALDLYYNQDYSLAEIAENMDISRQGVRDFVKRGEQQLLEFEAALHLSGIFSDMTRNLDSLKDALSGIREVSHSPQVLEYVEQAENIAAAMEKEIEWGERIWRLTA